MSLSLTQTVSVSLHCLFTLAAPDWYVDEGVIDKKTWLAFLSGLDEKS
jgi:hypothetical protein